MTTPFYDPELLRLWSLVADLPSSVSALQIWATGRQRTDTAGLHHLHPIPTVAVGLRGVARFESPDGRRIDLHPGEALLIGPCVLHHHAPLRRGSAILHLGFVAGWSDVALAYDDHWLWGRVPRQPLRGMLDAMLAAAEPGVSAGPVEALREVLRRLVDERMVPLVMAHPALVRMANQLWWNIGRGITANDLIRVSGLGASRAHRLFREFFGSTPKQEILAQRLEMALHLLRSGVDIGHTAARCGFSGRPDLTRAFRRRFGVPPRRWREVSQSPLLATVGIRS